MSNPENQQNQNLSHEELMKRAAALNAQRSAQQAPPTPPAPEATQTFPFSAEAGADTANGEQQRSHWFARSIGRTTLVLGLTIAPPFAAAGGIGLYHEYRAASVASAAEADEHHVQADRAFDLSASLISRQAPFVAAVAFPIMAATSTRRRPEA